MRLERRRRGWSAVRFELALVARVGEELEAAVARRTAVSARQRARLFIGRGQLARLDLARLDIGLVERIDADDRAGDRGRHLPAEKLLAELQRSRDRDAHNRVPGRFERRDRPLLFAVLAVGEPQIGEQPIVRRRPPARPVARHRPA